MMDDEEFYHDDPDSGSGDDDSENENDYFPIREPMVTSTQTRDSSEQITKSSSSQSNPTTTNEFTTENFEYTVLSPDDIVKYMVDCIKEVNEVIKLPLTTVRLLLHHFRWDKEKLMERFYDPDHQDELFRQARIVNPFRNSTINAQASQRVQRVPSASHSSTRSRTLQQTCAICCAERSSEQMTGHECGHSFCKDCWRIYLRIKIIDEGVGQTIPCPGKCDILVDDKLVLTMIDEENIRRKYQHLITNSFVECNRNMRWCPGKNCTNAIKAPYCDVAKVKCTSCQTSFCFQCGLPWHEPIKCKWLRKWHKKCHDDSETSNWIAAHTKECPKCHATIEKNGGCNHLICKNQACKYEFCWVCLGPWEPHGSSWYNCNRFNEDDAKKARDDQERSRAALQRYLHYYKRYHNHHESLRFENKLLEEVNKRMESMQQHMSWIEVQFLKNACITLRQCRETLMYTYPFAFYLKKNNHSIIFEQNQADLEHATELLSGLLERDSFDATNLTQLKLKVQDKSSYCSTRRKVLLNHVTEGYEKDYWEYQDDV